MAKKPKGYYSKGKVTSEKAALRAKYGNPRSLKGIAGIVGGAIIEGIGGPKAKAAGAAVKGAAKLARPLTQAEAKAVRTVSKKLASRNKTQPSRAGDKVKINPAALGSKSKSGKPTPNRGGGLRTTTGRGKSRITKGDVYEAVRGMSSRPGGSPTTTGTGAIRTTAPKPYVRVTTRTAKGEKVQKPLKKTNPKEKGGAITVRKTTPRKAEDVRNEMSKAKRDRVRRALTVAPKPIGPNRQVKLDGVAKGKTTDRTDARSEEILNRYYRIRFGDSGGPVARGGKPEPRSINQRIAEGVEESPRSSGKSNFDKEAEGRITESLAEARSGKPTLKPGQSTKVTRAIRKGTNPEIKRAVRNMRKVLNQREITAAAERSEKALQNTIKAMVKRGASKSEIDRVIAAKRKADSIGARVSVPRPRRSR